MRRNFRARVGRLLRRPFYFDPCAVALQSALPSVPVTRFDVSRSPGRIIRLVHGNCGCAIDEDWDRQGSVGVAKMIWQIAFFMKRMRMTAAE